MGGASPPEQVGPDASLSRRMGLFVVGRLAARYGIRVRLRGSFYGGITAMVLLPTEILVAVDTRGGELEASRIEPAEVASGLVRTVGGAGPTP